VSIGFFITYMQPQIIKTKAFSLAGLSMEMSIQHNKVKELWSSFIPILKKNNLLGIQDLYSVEEYQGLDYFQEFNPEKTFKKWAAIKIKPESTFPDTFEPLQVPEGLYAVFSYKGKATEANKFYHFIFNHWLPGSEYVLDTRPHFAIMGEKYKGERPDSEEDIWIPVKPK
jgi:AraC family transcriptional regulator